VLSTAASAQEATKIPRIGFVTASSSQKNVAGRIIDVIRRSLGELGYVEGKNVLYEYRFIDGQQDKAANLVAELLDFKVDVLVVSTLTSLRAAKQATKIVPIVMVTTNDPVATGIVDSLARPGGNITGNTRLTRDISGKRPEVLGEMIPRLSRVAVLWDAKGPGPTIAFNNYEAAAKLLKVKVQSLEIRGLSIDFERAFHIAAKEHASAIIPIRSSVLIRNMDLIADLAIKNRLPSMNETSDFVEAGGLSSYSADDTGSFKRAAVYIDKILKGAKPADLPVEQPTKFEFVINLKAAKQIGLAIPPNVLAQANRVIK